MVKKAGIVVGVVIMLLAIGVYVLVNVIENKKSGVPVEPEIINRYVDKPNVEKDTVISKDIILKVINKDNLGAACDFNEEIMVVKKKKMFLIDFDISSKENKQLYYSIDLISDDFGCLTHFLSEVAYESINIGDKLLVEYKVFKNDIGVRFPVIIKVVNTD